MNMNLETIKLSTADDEIKVREAGCTGYTDTKTNQTAKFISRAIYLRKTAAEIRERKKVR